MSVLRKKDFIFAFIHISRIKKSGCQRELDVKRAERMSKNWKWNMCKVLTVNDREKIFTHDASNMCALHLIDGQHRLEAAKLAGIEYLPCQILQILQKDEYDTFVELQKSTKPISTYDMYMSEWQQGKPYIVKLHNVLVKYGIMVAKRKNNVGKRITCGAIMGIINSHGKSENFYNIFDQTIQVLSQAWPDDPFAFNGSMVSMIYSFILRAHYSPKYKTQVFINKLQKKLPANILAHVGTREIVSNGILSLTEIYNYKRSKELCLYAEDLMLRRDAIKKREEKK